MTTKRAELINAIISGLSIEEDPYAIETVNEKTESLDESQYLDFYQAVMAANTFGNGVKAVIEVAEQFKPKEINHAKSKAEFLIRAVEAMNTVLWNEARDVKRVFEDFVEEYEFDNVSNESKAILNNVAPYYDIAQLTINIRQYQTGSDAITAFKRAIEQSPTSDAIQIANPLSKLQIRKG